VQRRLAKNVALRVQVRAALNETLQLLNVTNRCGDLNSIVHVEKRPKRAPPIQGSVAYQNDKCCHHYEPMGESEMEAGMCRALPPCMGMKAAAQAHNRSGKKGQEQRHRQHGVQGAYDLVRH
jgi:hypothetical protein